jgi:hypothetical protein
MDSARRGLASGELDRSRPKHAPEGRRVYLAGVVLVTSLAAGKNAQTVDLAAPRSTWQ